MTSPRTAVSGFVSTSSVPTNGRSATSARGSRKSELMLLDVTSISYGFQTVGDLMTTVIKRNSTIPTKKTVQITTFTDFQEVVMVNIYAGERPMTRRNIFLGGHFLTGLQQAPAGEVHIDVTFDIDANGKLMVELVEKDTGNKNAMDVCSAKDITHDQIEYAVMDAEKHRSQDLLSEQTVIGLKKMAERVKLPKKMLLIHQKLNVTNTSIVLRDKQVVAKKKTPVTTEQTSLGISKLFKYGIGVNFRSCVVTQPTLKLDNLDKLLDLIKNDGHWESTAELDAILGVDFNICVDMLKKAGISSLGSRATGEIHDLIFTILVLLSMWKLLCPEIFPISVFGMKRELKNLFKRVHQLTTSSQLKRGLRKRLRDKVEQALGYCEIIDDNNPMVYSTLELGSSWQEIGLKLLGLFNEEEEVVDLSRNYEFENLVTELSTLIR